MQIVMYGTPTCSVCKQAKEWLEEKGIEYTYYDLTAMETDDARVVLENSGMKTVPIIYDWDNLIGGFSELKTYVQGELF